jgi:hypothetical protein
LKFALAEFLTSKKIEEFVDRYVKPYTYQFIKLLVHIVHRRVALKNFLVTSAILLPGTDPKACALGSPQRLKPYGVNVKTCYCCGPEGRVVFVVEAQSREAALDSFFKINVPVASIVETEEVLPKK